MTGEILIERLEAGTIGRLVINRPEVHNAVNLSMWRQLAAGVRALGADTTVRVLILRGAGDRAFASGADLAELPDCRATYRQATLYHSAIEDALTAIAEVEQPVIAMIHGYCIGGGCELAGACDFRLADDRASFGIPAARLGVVLGLEELRGLVHVVGLSAAIELLVTGRRIDAGEALRIGLVNRVVPPAELEGAVMELASGIAKNVPVAVGAAKRLLRALVRGDDPDRIRSEHAAYMQRALCSPEYVRTIAALRHKEPPVPPD